MLRLSAETEETEYAETESVETISFETESTEIVSTETGNESAVSNLIESAVKNIFCAKIAFSHFSI